MVAGAAWGGAWNRMGGQGDQARRDLGVHCGPGLWVNSEAQGKVSNRGMTLADIVKDSLWLQYCKLKGQKEKQEAW